MDSTKINIELKIPKDTLIKINNGNSINIKYLSDTIITKSKCCDTIWINPIRDIIVQYEWPITIIIFIIIFHASLKRIINNLSDFINRSKEIRLTKEGVIIIAQDKESPDKLRITASTDKASENIPKSLLEDKMTNKIFSTFWKYQKEHIEEKHKIRWTFTLVAVNKEYDSFIKSIIRLIKLGCVNQDIKSQQFYLTDIGIDYCKTNEKELKSEVFTF